MNQTAQFLISHGDLFLFLIVFADQSGLPIPAAPWLLAAGALAAGGQLTLPSVILWAAVASLVADAMWFYIGQRGKSRIFRAFPSLKAIRPWGNERVTTRLILRGTRILTFAKLLPFGTVVPVRAGALMRAGSLSRPTVLFLLVDALSSVAYAGVYVLAGFFLHNQLEQVVAVMRKLGVFAFLVLLLVVGPYLSYAIVQRRRIRQGPRKTAPGSTSQLRPQPERDGRIVVITE